MVYCNLLLVVLCFAHVRGAVSSSGTVPEKTSKKAKKAKKIQQKQRDEETTKDTKSCANKTTHRFPFHFLVLLSHACAPQGADASYGVGGLVTGGRAAAAAWLLPPPHA